MRQRRHRLPRRAFAALGLGMGCFGLATGLAFPWLARLVGLPAQVAERPAFAAACVVAGLVVAGINYMLARCIVGRRVARLASQMAVMRSDLLHATTADPASHRPGEGRLPVGSADELGAAAAAFNDLLDAVARARAVERAVAAVSTAAASTLEPAGLAEAALQQVLDCTGSRGGALLGTEDGAVAVLASRNLPTRTSVQLREVARSVGAGGTLTVPWHLPLSVTPLRIGQDLVGLLALDPHGSGGPGADALVRLLADSLAVALSNAQLHARTRRQATLDDLTGLPNRRLGLNRVTEALAQRRHADDPVGVLLVDVDHFKAVNDTRGHQVGDLLLAHLAATAAAELRRGDTLSRYGGEELLAVLPGAGPHVVAAVAQRLRAAVAAAPLPHPDGPVPATVSVGCANAGPGTTLESLIAAADRALYAAKAAGRNRVHAELPQRPGTAAVETSGGAVAGAPAARVAATG